MQMDLETHFARFQRTGDPAALAVVFDQAAPRLLLLAIHLTGDELGAEDLVQSTFVRLIESAPSYDASRPFLPWASTILANEARRSWRRRQLELDRAQPPRAPVDDPRELAQAAETFDALTRAIDGLDETHRSVVNLRVVHGMKPGEIARVLSLSPELARTRLSRGLKRLRGALPPSLAGSVAVAISARGLAQVRAEVLARARDVRPAVAATGGVGGVGLSVAAVAAVLVALAALVWILPPGGSRTAAPEGLGAPVSSAATASASGRELDSPAPPPTDGARRVATATTAQDADRTAAGVDGWRLSGRVRSRDGAPLVGAEVRVSILHGCDLVALTPVHTDAEGRYTLSVDALRSRGDLGLLSAGLLVQASAAEHWPQPAELIEELSLQLDAATSLAKDFTLTPGRTVHLGLQTPEGAAPAGDVIARLVPSSADDANASALDRGAPEWSSFEAGEPIVLPVRGAAPYRLEARCDEGLLFEPLAAIPSDGDLGARDLQRFSVVAGRLVGPDGHAVPHQNLRIQRLGAESPLRTDAEWTDGAPRLADVGRERTDAAGRFYFAGLAPGRYELELEYSLLPPVRFELEADAAPRDFTLDGQTLVLRTIDAEGQLVPGLELRYACGQDGSPRSGRLDINDVGGVFELLVPFESRWRFTSGTWRVAFEPREHVASREDAHAELELRVAPAPSGGRLELEARDGAGQIVKDFAVDLHHLETDHYVGPLNRDALAELDLPTGGYEVTLYCPARVSSPDATFLPRSFHIEVELGRTSHERISVERGGRVEFAVEPPNWPVLDAPVTIEVERAGRWSHAGGILQERDGIWQLPLQPDLSRPLRTFTVLPGGSQRLRLRAGEARSSAVECIVQPGALSRARVAFDAQ